MPDAIRFRPSDGHIADDTTSPGSTLTLFDNGLGQHGLPFVTLVSDPPNHTRPRHHHHGDVTYLYLDGEHHIEGEGTYQAGDVRFVKAGHAYGPETTGPNGGTWWIVSKANPIPITAHEHSPKAPAEAVSTQLIPTFVAGDDWAVIDAAVLDAGAAIVRGLIPTDLVVQLNNEIGDHLDNNAELGLPSSGSGLYNAFLGHRTVRLHGLARRFNAAVHLLDNDDLSSWADRMLAPTSASTLLNAGELIQIGPGEAAQFPPPRHRLVARTPDQPRPLPGERHHRPDPVHHRQRRHTPRPRIPHLGPKPTVDRQRHIPGRTHVG